MDLQGKVGYITGGSKGIGFAVAKMMLENGMRVAITGSRSENLTLAVKSLQAQYGPQIIGIVSDVRHLSAEEAAIQEVLARWQQIDVVVANAGVGHFSPFTELTPEQWQATIDINLTGVFNTCKAAIHPLINSKGYLITIASLGGTNFFAQGTAYNASKFGLVGFTQALMLDVRDHDVKVTTIMPGSVATQFNGRTVTEKDAWKIQPEDIGQIVIDVLKMPARTLPSKIEVRPSKTGKK